MHAIMKALPFIALLHLTSSTSHFVRRNAADIDKLLDDDDTEFNRLLHEVGRCRAWCIDRFGARLPALSDQHCQSEPDCLMCWDNCEMFSENFEVWGAMCSYPGEICFDGCQLACELFTREFSKSPAKAGSIRASSEQIRLIPDLVTHSYIMRWNIDTRGSALRSIIYSIFWLPIGQRSPVWEFLLQTVDTEFRTNDSNIIDRLGQIRIVAIGPQGPLVQIGYPPLTIPSIDLPITTSADISITTRTSSFLDYLSENHVIIIVVSIASIIGGVVLTFTIILLTKLVEQKRRARQLERSNAFRNDVLHSRSNSSTNLLQIGAQQLSARELSLLLARYVDQPPKPSESMISSDVGSNYIVI